MWRLTNVPSQAMTTVYLLKQMIRLRSARSSRNTLERLLLKTHQGSAHTAGSPPCSQCLGQSQLQRNTATAGTELAMLLSDPLPQVRPSPQSPQWLWLIHTCPQEGWHGRVPELQIANRIFQEPSGWIPLTVLQSFGVQLHCEVWKLVFRNEFC